MESFGFFREPNIRSIKRLDILLCYHQFLLGISFEALKPAVGCKGYANNELCRVIFKYLERIEWTDQIRNFFVPCCAKDVFRLFWSS